MCPSEEIAHRQQVINGTFNLSHTKWPNQMSTLPLEPVGNSVMPPTGAGVGAGGVLIHRYV